MKGKNALICLAVIGLLLVPSVYGQKGDNISQARELNTKTVSSGYNITLNGTMGKNGWYVSNVVVTITGLQGNESVFYCIDQGHWQSYTSPLIISKDGTHPFTAIVIGQDGNVTMLDPLFFKIDKTSPIVELDQDILLLKIKWATHTEDDVSGLDRVEFWLGSSLQQTVRFYQPYGMQTATWVLKGTLLRQIRRHHANDNVSVVVYDLAGNFQWQSIG